MGGMGARERGLECVGGFCRVGVFVVVSPFVVAVLCGSLCELLFSLAVYWHCTVSLL